MIRRPPRSTLSSSSAASDVYKRQGERWIVCLLANFRDKSLLYCVGNMSIVPCYKILYTVCSRNSYMKSILNCFYRYRTRIHQFLRTSALSRTSNKVSVFRTLIRSWAASGLPLLASCKTNGEAKSSNLS